MTIRTLLVPVRGDGKHEVALDHAAALARRFGAHIDVVHCRPRAEDMLPFGVVVPASVKAQLTASAGGVADEEEIRLKAVFQDYCGRHDCVMVQEGEVPPMERLSISWRERTGKQPTVVALLGRLADVIVLARPDRHANLGYGTLEAALFDTGRLVLMCPPKKAGVIGDHVAVGWNGSREASRAIAIAMPALAAASAVTVIALDTGEPPALPGEALVQYLQAHGIKASLGAHASAANRVGQALLDGAAKAGADLLLIGAYGQNRLREMVMGGATRHIVDHATLPVLMTH